MRSREEEEQLTSLDRYLESIPLDSLLHEVERQKHSYNGYRKNRYLYLPVEQFMFKGNTFVCAVFEPRRIQPETPHLSLDGRIYWTEDTWFTRDAYLGDMHIKHDISPEYRFYKQRFRLGDSMPIKDKSSIYVNGLHLYDGGRIFSKR